MELLHFVFSSFWTFIGTITLVGLVFEGFIGVIKAARSPRLGLPMASHLISINKDGL